MKILFLGHYLEGNTGWSRAAQELIAAFDASGADIVCRPVILQGGGKPSAAVRKCEAKSTKDCDIVIQCLLPQHLSYSGKFKKNIAIPFLETYGSSDNDWFYHLSKMDEIWISSDHLDHVGCFDLCKKVKHINVPTDISKYKVNYFPQKIPHLYNDYVFYYVGDMNKRKNIADTVRAFQLAFTKNDPVSLVLKVNKFGFNQQEVYQIAQNDINQIHESMRLYPKLEDYKPITIISNEMPNEGIYSLHQMFDCYVSTSRGEGWNYPLVDAIGFGNSVITTNYPQDLASHINYSVSDGIEPVTHMFDTFANQFTSNELWKVVDYSYVSELMREQYNKGKVKNKVDLSILSYKTCGEKMMEKIYE